MNDDGQVNAQDVLQLLRNYKKVVSDISGDGIVNMFDIVIPIIRFGT